MEFYDGFVVDVVVGDVLIEVEVCFRDGKVMFVFEFGDWEIFFEDLIMEWVGFEEFLW